MTAVSIRNRTRDLEQKVALVTGGAHGLGRQTCSALAWAGARVVVVDVDERGGDAVARAVGGAFIAADLPHADANHDVVAAVMEQHGRLDLVHLGPSAGAEPMTAMVDRVTNGTLAALPAFESTGDGGAIVAASLGPSGAPAHHALIGIARALGAILAPRQARFNAVVQDVRAVDSADAGDSVVALLAGEASGECWLVRSARDDAQRPPSALRA